MAANERIPECVEILLVEDNDDDAFLTVRALRKANVINEVKVVRDGAEALDYLFARNEYADRHASGLPCLVLLDIQLPKLTGVEVLERLRADERTRLLPVVMLTSSEQEEGVVGSYEHGANSYVQKPVDQAAFTRAVQELGFYWLLLNTPPNVSSGVEV